jgi:hypothetical protein
MTGQGGDQQYQNLLQISDIPMLPPATSALLSLKLQACHVRGRRQGERSWTRWPASSASGVTSQRMEARGTEPGEAELPVIS